MSPNRSRGSSAFQSAKVCGSGLLSTRLTGRPYLFFGEGIFANGSSDGIVNRRAGLLSRWTHYLKSVWPCLMAVLAVATDWFSLSLLCDDDRDSKVLWTGESLECVCFVLPPPQFLSMSRGGGGDFFPRWLYGR